VIVNENNINHDYHGVNKMSQRFHQQSRDLLKHHHLTVVSSVVYNCTGRT